jgi:hypothetical protein
VIDGDLVVRGEADGTTIVLVTVTLGERSAVGHVRVRAPVDAAARSRHLQLARARAWQVLATTLASVDEDLAFDAARRGVRALDGCCAHRNILDDTGMYAKHAELQFRQGDRAPALTRMISVLRSRLYIYVRVHRPHAL